MERHFKQEFCVLVIMNWNVLITRMFSIDFIMFWLYKSCNQQKIKGHISSFNEVSCCLKWTANCGKYVIGHYTFKGTSDTRYVYCKRNLTSEKVQKAQVTPLIWAFLITCSDFHTEKVVVPDMKYEECKFK